MMIERYSGLAIMVAMTVVGAATSLRTDWADPFADPFVDGATQAAIEDAIDDALVIRTASIQGWTAFRYAVFGEGLPGVVPGRNGWLFTDEEFIADDGFEARRQASVARIVSDVETLQAMGSTVIVALLPDKARVMSEHVVGARPPQVEARYEDTRADLAALGVQTVDLLTILGGDKSTSDPFLRTDTHWTPEGAARVAAALAPAIRSATSTRTTFETLPEATIEHDGDLLAFLDTGPFASVFGFDPESVVVQSTLPIETADAGSLFGDATVNAVLVGTSYSAIPKWNFLGFLQQASETDILNMAEEGNGPFVPMTNFLTELANGVPIPEVVIWEIPERYLTLEKLTD